MYVRNLRRRSRRFPNSAFDTPSMRAWIYGLNEQFEKQATHLLARAFSSDDKKTSIVCYSRLLQSPLALLVREIELGELGLHAESLLEQITWPEEQTTARFYTQRALAWQKALRGDWIPAMRLLDGAFAFAPDAMRRGLVFADRARISMAIGEHVSASLVPRKRFRVFFRNRMGTSAQKDEAMGVFAAMDVLRDDPGPGSALFACAEASHVSKVSAPATVVVLTPTKPSPSRNSPTEKKRCSMRKTHTRYSSS